MLFFWLFLTSAASAEEALNSTSLSWEQLKKIYCANYTSQYGHLSAFEHVTQCLEPLCWGCKEYKEITRNYGAAMEQALQCMG